MDLICFMIKVNAYRRIQIYYRLSLKLLIAKGFFFFVSLTLYILKVVKESPLPLIYY